MTAKKSGTGIIDVQLAASEIHDKASAELAELRLRIPQLEEQLRTNIEEQQSIQQAHIDDDERLANAHDTDAKAALAQKEALEYVRYALGLSGEKDATRTALEREDSAKAAHTIYEQMASGVEQREATRVARLEQLQGEYATTQAELTACHAQMAMVARIEATALEQLGKSTYDRLAQEYQSQHQARLEQAREQLAVAKMEEQRFFDRSAKELELWPERAAQLLPKEIYHDETTQSMQAYIDLIDAMVGSKQGTHLAPIQQLPSVRTQYLNFRDFFLITSNDLYALNVDTYHQATLKPMDLLRRRDMMQKLLDEYRKE